VVLIGHSQGGLLVKLFLIGELLAGRGEQLKVDIVFTLDTPHRGPMPWVYAVVFAGWLWSLIPFLNRKPFLRQASELSRWSRNMKRLERYWSEELIAMEPQAPRPHLRHIRSYTASGTRPPFFPWRLVVSERSARGFEIDEPLPFRGRRVQLGVGHAVDAMDEYRHHIEQLLSDHDYENMRSLEAALAAADYESFAATLKDHCPEDSLWCEISCWQRRVVSGFEARPLRCLPMPDALERFIRVRLKHP
jgi:hypothetical protein